jgi:hypothetical protein
MRAHRLPGDAGVVGARQTETLLPPRIRLETKVDCTCGLP